MATYLELFTLKNDSDLQDRVSVAVVKAAQTILATVPTPAADRVAWAASVKSNPGSAGKEALHFVLAANSGAAVSQIQGSTDAAIQSNVDDLVDGLVLAHATPPA